MTGTFFALSGLAATVLGWLLMFILPDARLYSWIIVGIGALLIVVALAMEYRRVGKAISGARGKFGIGTAVGTSLFVAIVVLANAFSVSFSYRLDLTGSAQFTLSTRTKEYLQKLETPVEAITFFSPRVPLALSSYATSLLKEYRNSARRMTVRDIDPDVHPDEARKFGVDQTGAMYGTIVFKSGDRQRKVYGPQVTEGAEQAFTSAILEVTGTVQKKIYFLAGHGEGSIDREFSLAAGALRDNLFAVSELDLLSSTKVPDDAAALVIAGSRDALADAELLAVDDFLKDGGCALMLLNPDPPSQTKRLLESWWLEIPGGTVVDPSSFSVPSRESILVPRTRNSFQLAEVNFPGAAAVIPLSGAPAAVELKPLVWTSKDAWLATGEGSGSGSGTGTGKAKDGGPFALGALISMKPDAADSGTSGTRIAVVGDSDFASNAGFRNGSNGELFLAAVNWLTAGRDILSIDRKALTTRRLLLSPEQARFFNFTAIGLMPLLLALAGILVWWRRK